MLNRLFGGLVGAILATSMAFAIELPGPLVSTEWFVLSEFLGYGKATLYDGSMHAWMKHDLPTETKLR